MCIRKNDWSVRVNTDNGMVSILAHRAAVRRNLIPHLRLPSILARKTVARLPPDDRMACILAYHAITR
jgi:predicted metal-binding protein